MTDFHQNKENRSSTNLDTGLDQISFLELLIFLKFAYKTIIVFAMVGIIGALLFLLAVPKQYEARAQIRMAQIASYDTTNNMPPRGTNLEEPNVLIARMALPTSYSSETIAICGLANHEDAGLALVNKVRLSIPNGVSGIVELRVRDPSKDTAKACVNAVFQTIKNSQAQLTKPFIDEASKKIISEKERLKQAIEIISNEKGGAVASAIYFSNLDEIRFLRYQIASLQKFITATESYASKLAAPIYVKDRPVFPQKRNCLLIGLLLGGFAGLALALARKWYPSNREALKELLAEG